MEDKVNKSLRNTIVREMVSNTLMHREFTSSYTAIEGDVFRIIVPLDEEYTYDFSADNRSGNATLEKKTETLNCDFEREKDKYATLGCDFGTKEEREIVRLIKENPFITQKELQQKTGISLGTVKRILPRLQENGILVREGGKRFGKWIIKN